MNYEKSKMLNLKKKGPIAMTYLILKFTNTMNMFLLQQLVRNIYCYNAQTEYFRTKFKFVHYQHQQPFLS